MTMNRYCASGLQAIAMAAKRIRGGGGDPIFAMTRALKLAGLGLNQVELNEAAIEIP